jgi:hypothetical protein
MSPTHNFKDFVEKHYQFRPFCLKNGKKNLEFSNLENSRFFLPPEIKPYAASFLQEKQCLHKYQPLK